jgi:hypothetical protein
MAAAGRILGLDPAEFAANKLAKFRRMRVGEQLGGRADLLRPYPDEQRPLDQRYAGRSSESTPFASSMGRKPIPEAENVRRL